MNLPELTRKTCDLDHETKINSYKTNWNKWQSLIPNQPNVEDLEE